MKYLFKRLLDSIKSMYLEIKFINNNKYLFKLLEEGVPLEKIADVMTRHGSKGITIEDVKSYIEALESLGYKDRSIVNFIKLTIIDYFNLIYLTLLSLVNDDIVSMGKYQEILDKINLLSDLKVTENKIHETIIVNSINRLCVSKMEYEVAVCYLNYLKISNK